MYYKIETILISRVRAFFKKKKKNYLLFAYAQEDKFSPWAKVS